MFKEKKDSVFRSAVYSQLQLQDKEMSTNKQQKQILRARLLLQKFSMIDIKNE